jgi:nucleotide-binding universal stress UspA family protein
MAYTHIIVPVDLSPHSQQTLRYAFEEAKTHRAKLTLLHVLQHHPDTDEYYVRGGPEAEAGIEGSVIAFPTRFDPDTGGRLPIQPAPPPAVIYRDYLEESRNQLQEFVPGDFVGDWEAVVVRGDPGNAIVDYAQEHSGDLIVMGSHGHTGLRHLLMGSVAEHVLRHVSCPVLIVRSLEEKC